MAAKDKQSFDENISKYTEFFKDDIQAIDEELDASKKYTDIINKEIETLKANNALGASKGSQHYLIQHIANAISLQTQREGLRKDKFAIKKAIIDYATKFAEDQSENKDEAKLSALIEELLSKDRKNISSENEKIENDEDLDTKIDSILETEL